MDGAIDTLYRDQEPQSRGLLLGIGLSLALHLTFVAIWLVRQPPPLVAPTPPPLEYVELSSPASQQFTEAPGAAVDTPVNRAAPLSDANRRAATPNPTGETATTRPGDGRVFNPDGGAAVPEQRTPGPQARPANPDAISERPSPAAIADQQQRRQQEVATATPQQVDWNAAIREAGREGVGTLPMPATVGGEEGYAESGPISFESQWYDWGPYSAQMVAKIRYHWFRNMPHVVKMGMKGVVTIRFTIQRSGTITDIEMIKSSGTPPLDFAARQAIQLASPLRPLPDDFPSGSERVTASFYYNLKPPSR